MKDATAAPGIKRTLAARFAAFVGVIIVCVTMLFAVANISSTQESRKRSAETRNASAATFVADLSGGDVTFREIRRLQSLIDKVVEGGMITRIAIHDAQGREMVAAGAPAFATPGDLATEALARTDVFLGRTGEALLSTAPILFRDEVVGVVLLEAPANGGGVVGEAVRVLLLGLLAIGIALPACYAVARQVTAPLRQLTEFAQNVSANDLSATKANIKTGDELEALAHAINRMIRRIDAGMSRIHRLSFVDPITELPNRDRFLRETTAALRRMDDRPLMVALINLNRFRWVNETLGPQSGDRLLAVVGGRLRSAAGVADKAIRQHHASDQPSVVARLSADEFALLAPGFTNEAEAARFLQMVIAAIRQPVEIEGHPINVTVAAGAVTATPETRSTEALIKNAELALKESKRANDGRPRFFTPSMNRAAMERLRLESELRKAVKEGGFFTVFQPKVRLADNRIVSAEALVRWRKGDEVISPGVFIPIAEELGLIGDIGEFVLKQACTEAARWRREGWACKVAVNVSPKQLETGSFADRVLETLRETGLPPSQLELEITESMAVSDPTRVTDIMRPLRAMGVRLAIDDFGAGHSNISTLTQLPFDVFKIDQQFVRVLHEDGNAPAIVEMILALAQALRQETVAEGVETTAQAEFLRKRGCTLGQGYLFSPPLESDVYLNFLKEWAAEHDGDAAEEAPALRRAAS